MIKRASIYPLKESKISKVDYTSKAKSSNVRDLIAAKNTVHQSALSVTECLPGKNVLLVDTKFRIKFSANVYLEVLVPRGTSLYGRIIRGRGSTGYSTGARLTAHLINY